jgi:hypothetical protein
MANPTKIELFHPKAVAQDSQIVDLCDVGMPARNFAQNERPFLQHGADDFDHIIFRQSPRLGSSHIEILRSAKLLHQSFTARTANSSASYSTSRYAAIAPVGKSLSARNSMIAYYSMNIHNGQTVLDFSETVST